LKFIHLSDLHLGKRVNEFSMLEDQAYILNQIIDIIDAEAPDGVLVAGDVYDRPLPPIEAVELLDGFLVALSERGIPVFLISGNHDSAERLAFGGRLMEGGGVHISPAYGGAVAPITLTDGEGPVDVYLLPFVKPALVRRYFPEEEIVTYTDALRAAIDGMGVDSTHRNILVTHQFVTGATRSESEDLSVGGADNVDEAVFAPFDYVALGHLHAQQQVGRETIRYCGAPLKYAFSEAGQEKSVTVVELGPKGSVDLRTVPLHPLRELRELRGTYLELTARSFYAGTTYPADYLHITLTDEEDIPDAIGKLRAIYPLIMRLDYDNTRTREDRDLSIPQEVERRSPLDLFEKFYEEQNNQPMSEEQRALAAGLLEEIEEGER